MNFTRNGKIARLPRAIRSELNQRLAESEPTESLLPWLNSLPEVQQVLAQRFAGQPISEQNLSAWRQGGFAEWERAEGAREWAERMVEDCHDIEGISGQRRLAEHMAVPVLMELMQLMQTASTCEDLSERRRTVLGVARQITQLTRTGHQTERLDIERARWKYEEHEHDVEEVTKMTSREHDRQLIEQLLYTAGEDTDSESGESDGNDYAPGAYLGEEDEAEVATESNGTEPPAPSSPIKVHQGHQTNGKEVHAQEDPSFDIRAHFRNFELQKLRGQLLAEQTTPFRELITGRNHRKRPSPELDETTPDNATTNPNATRNPARRKKRRSKPKNEKGPEGGS